MDLNLSTTHGTLAEAENRLEAMRRAAALYEQARSPGWLGRAWAILRRQPRRLLDLAGVEGAAKVRGRHYAGLRAVPIACIRGTEGRERDFDVAFHPLRPHTRNRWLKIAVAHERGEILPPVELIQVGDIYFVRDGHHRISVAAARGQAEVDAEVTVWELGPACPCTAAAA
jgi:hypothetical protein